MLKGIERFYMLGVCLVYRMVRMGKRLRLDQFEGKTSEDMILGTGNGGFGISAAVVAKETLEVPPVATGRMLRPMVEMVEPVFGHLLR